MREILFRAKRDKRYCETQDWTYGVPFIDYDDDCIFKTSYSELVVMSETVGQYTGLKDKNGTKIFEGDILLVGGTQKVVVLFEDGQFVVSHYSINLLKDRTLESEVIGNIHDDPELLEE